MNQQTRLQIEPYVKYFDQLININRYKMFGQDPNYLIEEGLVMAPISVKWEVGRSSLGMLFVLKHKPHR